MDKDELVQAVKAHALHNYNKDGWDYVVETMSDDDIRKAIGKANTIPGAIRKVASLCGLWDEQRSEVQATAW
jgi:hypothetical protein